jgi:thiaminase/transcriptional activator TenA
MAGVEPASATLAYTEFLLATAATAGLGTVFAAGSVHAALRMAWRGTRLLTVPRCDDHGGGIRHWPCR